MNAISPPRDLAAPEALATQLAARRQDFPILRRQIHGKPLVYLDNAASAQKPQAVIAAMTAIYETSYANVHRGLHQLSNEATEAFEHARARVQGFLGAKESGEIVFTHSGTEAINLVAAGYAAQLLEPGDEILVSVLEHHANFVPWQLAAERSRARLRVLPTGRDGTIDLDQARRLLTEKVKILAIAHVSNVLGSVSPLEALIALAKARGCAVLVDGCQAAPRRPLDMQALGCDFYVFTGHKVYGPTGIGVLYGRKERLAALPPYQSGGGMIIRVTAEKTTFQDPPLRFEAGTPPIVEAVGLACACDYLQEIGLDAVQQHECHLAAQAQAGLGALEGVTVYGPNPGCLGIVSFNLADCHAHDVATVLDQQGIAVRAGHHCAQPLMDHLGITACVRASFGLYTTADEVRALIAGVARARAFFLAHRPASASAGSGQRT